MAWSCCHTRSSEEFGLPVQFPPHIAPCRWRCCGSHAGGERKREYLMKTNWMVILAVALTFASAIRRADATVRWWAQSSGGTVVGQGTAASGENIDIAVNTFSGNPTRI